MRTPSLCLLLWLLHGIFGPAAAQSREVPEWVVPVLRLVSTTHVEPTTGVVLSGDGLVLVPADFAAPGDEIIVLDGGTDIVRNGRPARLEKGFPDLGLEVLRVEGLQRTSAPLAPESPGDGSSLRLRAFPPAEKIAEGAQPINEVTIIRVFPGSDSPAVAADTPLPNVTGPLLDECGNLAAFSLADGIQSLSASPATQYRWGPALRTVLAELRLPVTGAPCSAATALADESEAPSPDETKGPETLGEPPVPEPEPSETDAPDGETVEDEPPAAESTVAEAQIDLLPPFEEDTSEEHANEEGAAMEPAAEAPATWPWLVAALLMLAAGFTVYRLRRGGGQEQSGPGAGAHDVDESTAVPDPKGSRFAEELDSRLILCGMLADGRPFEVTAAVSRNAINLEIGRGGADLVIDSVSVSRRHARLNGASDALTLTDLGSSNGSAINGVPCLEGEIMYLEPGDTVVLGDARFTVAVEAAAGEGE